MSETKGKKGGEVRHLEIPKSRHRDIIGSMGATVARLERESGAAIKLPPRNATDSRVAVRGSPAQIAACVKLLSAELGYDVSAATETRFVDLPRALYGRVIGPGGAELNALRRASGCAIAVPRAGEPPLVRLDGTPAALTRALQGLEASSGQSLTFADDATIEAVRNGTQSEKATGGRGGGGGKKGAAAPAPAAAKAPLSDATPHAERDERPASAATKRFVWGAQSEQHWQSFCVPKSMHGGLIGRRGATLQAIEAAAGVRVRVPPKDAPASEPVRVFGTPDQLEKACDAMADVLGFVPTPVPATAADAATADSESGAPAQSGAPPAAELKSELKLFVPHSCFRELIGPKGATVKAIESRQRVKVHIPRRGDKDKAVVVRGASDSALEGARREIEEVLGFEPSRTSITARLLPVDAKHFDTIVGWGGTTLRKLEDETECNIIVPDRRAKEQRVILEGNEKAIAAAVAAIEKLIGGAGEHGELVSGDEVVAALDDDPNVDDDADADDEAAEETKRTVPTKDEVADLAKACEHLWALDGKHRLTPNKDYTVNLQKAMAVYHSHDGAKEKFFERVENRLFARDTFRTFFALLDNYEPTTGRAETVTHEEKRENAAFINACARTPVMRYAHAWCVARGLAPNNTAAWKKMLDQAWFQPYSRGARNDTSGFEHVFVGEIKAAGGEKNVTGLHNWLAFYTAEKAGELDYKGYVVPHRRGRATDSADGDEHVLSLKFRWANEDKPVSTFLLGSTPEFELALYSMIFFNREEKNEITLDGVPVVVTSYRIRSRYGDKVGTVYPDAKK